MGKGNIVFAQSGNRKIAVNMDSFVSATYRHRRQTEALTFDLGSVGEIRQQTSMDMPDAREAFLALKNAANEPGSQLVYFNTDNAESVINLSRMIVTIHNPDDKREIWLELIGSSILLSDPSYEIWKALEAYAELELA